MALVKPPAAKPEDVEEYVNKRLTMAIEAGWRSATMWIKNASEKKALDLLNEAGYTFEVVKTEENSKQYNVSW